MAYVLVTTRIGSADFVAENLKQLKGIDETHILYGVYDIVTKATAESLDKIKETIGKIRKIENVLATLAMIVDEH